MLIYLARSCLFAVLNLLVGTTALLWTIWGRAQRIGQVGFFTFLMSWITFVISIVVVGQTLLGALGLLRPELELVLFGLLLLVSLRGWHRKTSSSLTDVIRETLRGGSKAFRAVKAYRLLPNAALMCFVLALIVGSVAEPSTMFDTLAYHMPMVVDWSQRGAVTPFYLPNADLANSYFPGNGELILLWSFMPLHSDVLTSLSVLLLWGLAGLAVLYLLRQLGIPGDIGAAVSLVLILSPVALSEAIDPAWDVCSAGFFFLAMAHLMRFWRSLSVRDLALFALAAGLHLGTKYSGPVYAVILAIAFLLVVFWERRQLNWAGASLLSSLAILCVTLTGGFWYIRNYWVAGNPMYPLDISFLGWKILPGSASPLWGDIRLWNHLFEPDVPRLYATAFLRGYGITLGLLLVGGAVASCTKLFHFWAGRVWESALGRRLLLFGFCAVVSTLAYLQTPYSIMRYTAETQISTTVLAAGMRLGLISVVTWVVVIAIFLWSLMDEPVKRLLVVVMMPLALIQSVLVSYDNNITGFLWRLFTYNQLGLAITLIACIGALHAVVQARCGRLRRSVSQRTMFVLLPAIFAAISLVGGLVLWRADVHRAKYRDDVYRREYGPIAEGWEWLWDNVEGSKIAYSGLPLSYPLYGSGYSNEVRYVNIAGELDWRHHDFTSRDTSYRGNMSSYESWLDNLRRWSAIHFVCSGDAEIVECEWAEDHPEAFRALYASPVFRVYRVLPGH